MGDVRAGWASTAGRFATAGFAEAEHGDLREYDGSWMIDAGGT